MRNYSSIIAGNDEPVDLVGDGWTEMFREVSLAATEHSRLHGRQLAADERAALFDHADLRTMERIRQRVAALVGPPGLSAAMQPWYGRWCKRPCFHDEYLPVFNRPNVTLVDTEGRGVDRITQNAVVVGDKSFPVDCLIFATGFEVGTAYTRRIGYDLVGRDGLHLSRKWADGLKTFHGLQTHGFPNLFFLGANQTGVTPNYTYMATEQSRHIAYIAGRVVASDRSVVEASPEAEREWVDEIRRLEPESSPYAATCTPSFLNGEGRPTDATGLLAGTYGAGPVAFADLLDAWRSEGSLHGLLLR
jgi:cyclohexanone monooxygenase